MPSPAADPMSIELLLFRQGNDGIAETSEWAPGASRELDIVLDLLPERVRPIVSWMRVLGSPLIPVEAEGAMALLSR